MKVKPVTHRELVSRLRKLGFEGPYSGGKHLFMIKEELRLTIPNPYREVKVYERETAADTGEDTVLSS